MGNVVELQSVRHGELQKLFDAQSRALTDLICAYAIHTEMARWPDEYQANLDRFLDAQRAFVEAYLALNKATGER